MKTRREAVLGTLAGLGTGALLLASRSVRAQGNPIERQTSGATDCPVTFTAAGRYPYYCELHEPTMAGVVWVK